MRLLGLGAIAVIGGFSALFRRDQIGSAFGARYLAWRSQNEFQKNAPLDNDLVLLFGRLQWIRPGWCTRPNVILIITDDQGFGDIGRAGELDCHDASADPLIASTPSTATQQRPISCSSPRTVLVAGENST